MSGMGDEPGWRDLIGRAPDELREMAWQRAIDLRLKPANGDRNVINMLRHEYSDYDAWNKSPLHSNDYHKVLDAIARDFPWLASACAAAQATREQRLPPWVQARRWAHSDAIDKQRRGREVAKGLAVGDRVIVKWRGQREAEIVEVRRSRVKARFTLKGQVRVIDRPADEVMPLTASGKGVNGHDR